MPISRGYKGYAETSRLIPTDTNSPVYYLLVHASVNNTGWGADPIFLCIEKYEESIKGLHSWIDELIEVLISFPIVQNSK